MKWSTAIINVGFDFRRQILTSIDARIKRLKSIPAMLLDLKSSQHHVQFFVHHTRHYWSINNYKSGWFILKTETVVEIKIVPTLEASKIFDAMLV